MKPTILFLTNFYNGASEEDIALSNSLRSEFNIFFSHPLDCRKILNEVHGVIIRNIWPTHEYQKEWDEIKAILRAKRKLTYNPLNGRGDINGKDYLVELSNKGYPVIPSIDTITVIEKLGRPEFYWIKPKEGCDGFGAAKMTGQELNNKNLDGYIIQPYVEFDYEPSFFFIDNKFHHAIRKNNRLKDEDASLYKPTEDDMEFAQKFVDWNQIPYGIQRIDAVRTRDGKLLLTEIEDIAPYLYILEIEAGIRESFVNALLNSIKTFLGKSVS